MVQGACQDNLLPCRGSVLERGHPPRECQALDICLECQVLECRGCQALECLDRFLEDLDLEAPGAQDQVVEIYQDKGP